MKQTKKQTTKENKTLCKWCEKETKEKFCSSFCKGEYYGFNTYSGDSLPIY